MADLLFKGGGLRGSVYLQSVFLQRADLARRKPSAGDEIIPFDLAAALRGGPDGQIPLRQGDEIVVYERAVTQPVRQEERFVEISGAVKEPGRFQYHDGMTLEDLLLRAGGFREDAFLRYAEVTRPIHEETAEGQNATRIEVSLTPMTDLASTELDTDILAMVDTCNVLATARRVELQHRDRVYIRTNPAFVEQRIVSVRGEVRYPGDYTLLHERETLAQVVHRAGGARPTGYEVEGNLFEAARRSSSGWSVH